MYQNCNIPQMVDMIEDHFKNDWGSVQTLAVSGIAGTQLFKHAIHACMNILPFDRIGVIEGCRDYIGLMRKPAVNYIYYLDLFMTETVPSIETVTRPMYHFLVRPKEGYVPILNFDKLRKYGALIIQNAHLIPRMYLKIICERYPGKILMIVDSHDVHGVDYWMNVPTLYDTLEKQSPLIALARSMFDVETRGIDRKVKCDFKTMKMRRTSIGKIDANQYVTNDKDILDMVQRKQRMNGFRRNQKVYVCSDHITLVKDEKSGLCHSIGPDDMLSISQASSPLMKMRIHSSANEFYEIIRYTDDGYGIFAKPANIITLDEAAKHRFNSIVFILGEEPMTRRMWYTLMKIANTISVVRYK